MKNITLTIFAFLFSTLVWAQQVLPLSGHRVLAYETYRLNQSGPVFVFLPGIYRGYSMDESFIRMLKQKEIPFVIMHFAEHPDSVAKTGTTKPDFSKVDADELANEVATLVRTLNIEFAIPVTLSYSSVVTAHLDKELFPFVVETAPIGKDTDGLPTEVSGFYEFWRAWLQTIPFYGEFWLQTMKQSQLRQHWGPWVDRYAERLPILKTPDYRERALQGYMALSDSAENFDLRKQDFAKGPRRFFILGQQEDTLRSQIQQEAIKRYELATGYKNDMVAIPEAGHNVPVDQPKAYVEVLAQIRAVLAH